MANAWMTYAAPSSEREVLIENTPGTTNLLNSYLKAILWGFLCYKGIVGTRLVIAISNSSMMGLLNMSRVKDILKDEIPAIIVVASNIQHMLRFAEYIRWMDNSILVHAQCLRIKHIGKRGKLGLDAAANKRTKLYHLNCKKYRFCT